MAIRSLSRNTPEELSNTNFGSNNNNSIDGEGNLNTNTKDPQQSYTQKKTSLFQQQNETTIEKFAQDATAHLFKEVGNAANQGGIGFTAVNNNTANSLTQAKVYKLFELLARLNGNEVKQKGDDVFNYTLYKDGNKIIGARYSDTNITGTGTNGAITNSDRFTAAQQKVNQTFEIDLDQLDFPLRNQITALLKKNSISEYGEDKNKYALEFGIIPDQNTIQSLIEQTCTSSFIGKDNQNINPYKELYDTCKTVATNNAPNFAQKDSIKFTPINRGYKYNDPNHKKYSAEVDDITKDIKSAYDEILKIIYRDTKSTDDTKDFEWKKFENYYNNKEKIDELMLQYNDAIKRRDAIKDDNYKNDDRIIYHVNNFKELISEIKRPINDVNYPIFLNNEDEFDYNPEFLNISDQHGVEQNSRQVNLLHNDNDKKVSNGFHEMAESLVGYWDNKLDTSFDLRDVRERIVNGIKTNGWRNLFMLPVAIIVSIGEGAVSIILLPIKIVALVFCDNKVSSRCLKGSIIDSIRNGFGAVSIFYTFLNAFKGPDQVFNSTDTNNDSANGVLSKTLAMSSNIVAFSAEQFLYSKNALSGICMVGYGLARLNRMGFNLDINGKREHISAKGLFSRWSYIQGTDKIIPNLLKKVQKGEKFDKEDILNLLHIYAVMEFQAGRKVDINNFQKLLDGTLPNQSLNHIVTQYANLDVHDHEIKKKLFGVITAATRMGLAIGAYYSYGTTQSTGETRSNKSDIETWFNNATADGTLSNGEKYQIQMLYDNGLISADTYNAGINGNTAVFKQLFANDYKLMDSNIRALNTLINTADTNIQNGFVSQKDLAVLSLMEKGSDSSMNSILDKMITDKTASITTGDFIDRTLNAGGTLSTFEQAVLKNQILSNPTGSSELLNYLNNNSSLSADLKATIQNAIGGEKLNVIMVNITDPKSIFYNNSSSNTDTYDTLLNEKIINDKGVVLDVAKFNQKLSSLNIGESQYASSFLTASPSGNQLNINTTFNWSNDISKTQYANGSALPGMVAPGSGGNGNIILNNNSGGNGNIIKKMTEISVPTSKIDIPTTTLNSGSYSSMQYENPYYYGHNLDYANTAIGLGAVVACGAKIAYDASQNPNTHDRNNTIVDSVKESTQDHAKKSKNTISEIMSRKKKEEIPDGNREL